MMPWLDDSERGEAIALLVELRTPLYGRLARLGDDGRRVGECRAWGEPVRQVLDVAPRGELSFGHFNYVAHVDRPLVATDRIAERPCREFQALRGRTTVRRRNRRRHHAAARNRPRTANVGRARSRGPFEPPRGAATTMRARGGDEQQRVQRGDASTNVVLSGLDGAATLSEREHHCRHAATSNPASTPGAAGDRCPHRQIGRRSGLPAPRHDAATPRDRPNETSSRLLAPGTDVS